MFTNESILKFTILFYNKFGYLNTASVLIYYIKCFSIWGNHAWYSRCEQRIFLFDSEKYCLNLKHIFRLTSQRDGIQANHILSEQNNICLKNMLFEKATETYTLL